MEGNTLLVKGKVRDRGERVQLTCQSVSLYQPSRVEGPTEGPTPVEAGPYRRQLQINLATTEDADADIVRLRQLFATLRQFPGEDEVYLAIVSNEGATKLEVPDLATGYCPQLHRQLVDLVGEQGLIVEDGK